MQKIMFNDRYGLTKAVLEGRKTMTRRIVNFDRVPTLIPGRIDVLFQDGTSALCSSVEPIPLTPEILEKNGWFYPKQSSWMKLDNPHKELWGCIHTDGTFWLYSSGDCDKDECFAEIKYVHELQHALRLCGIDKKIVV